MVVFLSRVMRGLPGVTQVPRKVEGVGGSVGFCGDTNFGGMKQGSPSGRCSKPPRDSFPLAGVCLVTTYSRESEQLSTFMLILRLNHHPWEQ